MRKVASERRPGCFMIASSRAPLTAACMTSPAQHEAGQLFSDDLSPSGVLQRNLNEETDPEKDREPKERSVTGNFTSVMPKTKGIFRLLTLAAVTLTAQESVPQAYTIEIPVMAYQRGRHTASEISVADLVVEIDGVLIPSHAIEWLGPARRLIPLDQSANDIAANRPLVEGNPDPATVILMDTKNIPPWFQTWCVQEVALFLAHLERDESVAVFQLTTNGLEVTSDFTKKFPELLELIAPGLLKVDAKGHLHLNEEYWRPIDPASADDFAAGRGNAGADEVRYRETWTGVEQVLRFMVTLKGRKNLFWISSAFPPLDTCSQSTFQPAGREASIECASEMIAKAHDVVIYPVRGITSDPFSLSPSARHSKSAEVRRFRHTVQTSQLRSPDNSMEAIAKLSGGRVIRTDTAGAAMFEVLKESRFSYILKYSTTRGVGNELHSIRITPKNPSIRLLYRRQVYSTQESKTNADEENALAAPVDETSIRLSLVSMNRQVAQIRVRTEDLSFRREGEMWCADLVTAMRSLRQSSARREMTPICLRESDYRQATGSGLIITVPLPASAYDTWRFVVTDARTKRIGSMTISGALVKSLAR